MFVTRRLTFIVLALLVLDEGLLLTVVSSSSDNINTDNDEQPHSAMLEKHEEISEENISKRSAMHVGNFSSYFQGQFQSSCSSCGLINPKRANFMIIQGDVVDPPYKYPWMVRLEIRARSGQTSLCGGSIISANYILTAAHCVINAAGPRGVRVLFLTSTHSTSRGPAVQQITMHPQYNDHNLMNDIALLKLQSRITCDKFKNPVCLPPSNFNLPVGAVCTAAGWGATQTGPRGLPRELREGKVKLVDYSRCARTYRKHQSHWAKMEYCFDGLSGKWQSICSGDSGGPTVYEQGGKYYQVGVASSASAGCQVGLPFMLASVPNYMNWIKQVTGSSF